MKIGLEAFFEHQELARLGRCGLVCNQASVAANFVHAIDIVSDRIGSRLACLFGPQHGMVATVQDNMIETEHSIHPRLGIPVYSLYSDTRKPSAEMLSGLDTLIIDLPIVGCRVYTYKATMRLCLEAAKENKVKVLVCDRPNPLGLSTVEGRVPSDDYYSFVAPGKLPMRHGLSAAEVASFLNQTIGAELSVLPLHNVSNYSQWDDLKRPWVLTSPNMPTTDSVVLYPGLVMLEGSNLSEGRGTCLPFQLIGAPYIEDPRRFCEELTELLGESMQGIVLRASSFMPCSQKWAQTVCRGCQIHIVDAARIASYQLGLAILHVASRYPGFEWSSGPYEYQFSKLPIDVIIGSKGSHKKIESLNFADSFWSFGVSEFIGQSEPHLLYERHRICA